MKNIIVFGAGMVGSAIAIDLVKTFKTTIADFNLEALNKAKTKATSLEILRLDVTDKAILKKTIEKFDMVVCAVPGFLGFETLKTIIESKKDVVDISFFPEDSLSLNALAIQNNVTAIVDCGVAPGMDNIILGYYNEILELTDFECIVGGLPKIKKWPFSYKAPFSPIDVIEEYMRPARYVENFKEIVREPLTDCEYVEFENIGTLESFNSDGLRSLIYTMSHIPNMKEKTLRYPGHVEYIKVLKESGFFNENTININGIDIKPLDFTSKILFSEWKLGESEEELTIMRITLKGKNKNQKTEEIIYNVHDTYCHKTKTSSMARTTGYTATAAVNLITNNLFNEKGVFPPELVGKHEKCFNYILNHLKERNIIYSKTSKICN